MALQKRFWKGTPSDFYSVLRRPAAQRHQVPVGINGLFVRAADISCFGISQPVDQGIVEIKRRFQRKFNVAK